MAGEKTSWIRVIVTTFFGATGAILIGLLFYHFKMFHYHNAGFFIIVYGISFSFLYAHLESNIKLNYLVSALIVFIANVIVFRLHTFNSISREFVYLSLLSGSVFIIHSIVSGSLKGNALFRIALWGILFGIGYALAAPVLAFIHHHAIVKRAILIYLQHGLILGTGIGSGLELQALLTTKNSNKKSK